MFANKFAEGYAGAGAPRSEDSAAQRPSATRTPSPRDICAAAAARPPPPVFAPLCALHAAAAADIDYLASRITFYMDDCVGSSADASPSLSRHSSSRARRAAPQPPCRTHARRSRSFHADEASSPPLPRTHLYRHCSDVCPGSDRRRPRATNRHKRSGGGGSGRRSASGGATPERGGSARSHRGGSGRQRRSSTAVVAVTAAAKERRGSLLLPHASLPPKERRRRLVVLIVIVTFMFLVVCSVLTVVVTLTNTSFHKSPPYNRSDFPVRKENEELMSAITRGGMYNNSAASNPPLEVSSTPDP